MQTAIYVDGFNLYYAIKKFGQYKWLNLEALAQGWLPQATQIASIKYFTARVSGAVDPDAPRRQQIYLNALQSLPNVQVIFGNFMPKNSWRPLLNLPIATRNCAQWPGIVPAGTYMVPGTHPHRPQEAIPVGHYPQGNEPTVAPHAQAIRVRFHHFEEKGSDVNLGAHLVNDAWLGLFEAAAVISNDTDLAEPIRIVSQERGLPVYLLSPKPSKAATKLASVSTHVRYLNKPLLKQAQFADPVNVGGVAIAKPASW